MNCLLDTHAFLWMMGEPERLSPKAREVIRNPDHIVYVSAVTAVEIAIKRSLGKLTAPASLAGEIARRDLLELPFQYVHGERMQDLPPHHADPFDRMLVAQALHEDLTLITHDRKFAPYRTKILWT